MRELLSNNSLFVGQLYVDKSLALRARDLIFFTTDLHIRTHSKSSVSSNFPVGQLYEDKSLALRARDLIFFTTDLQTVNYYSTNHALELIYFDSNTE